MLYLGTASIRSRSIAPRAPPAVDVIDLIHPITTSASTIFLLSTALQITMAEPKKPNDIQGGPNSAGYDPGSWYWSTRLKRNNPTGTALFTILRLADLPLQYWLLKKSYLLPDLIANLGGTPLSLSPSNHFLGQTTTSILGLSPYQALILGLATGSSAKQIYWKLVVNDTNMTNGFSTGVCIYNTLLNTLNAALAFWALTSQVPAAQHTLGAALTSAPLTIPVGLLLYSAGLFAEWYSEVQRKAFKARPENKDKPYSDGLFGLARNINYGGYTLWRTGYGLVCGGWVWGAVVAAWLAGDFCARAIPSLDAYCEKRVSLLGSSLRPR